ncbi:hypothetical protein Tco_0808469 [Tanacetum coccineum]
MELVTHQTRIILPSGMLLTRLYNHVMSNFPELSNDQYVLFDRVMYPLAPQHERKTRKDYGTKRGHYSISTSSSSAYDHPSPSHQIDDDNDEEDVDTHTPSPMAKFSSPSPPNASSKTLSTKETSSTLVTTSSSFESKPHSSPSSFSSSRNTPFPQPTNPFLDDSLDAPPRTSNPLPLQSHPSMNITLFLSPFTPLDHMFETPSPPPPPPPPQPPLMGHPIFFNILD